MYGDVFRLSSCSDRGMGRVVLCFPIFSVVTEIIPQNTLAMHRYALLLEKKCVLFDNFLGPP